MKKMYLLLEGIALTIVTFCQPNNLADTGLASSSTGRIPEMKKVTYPVIIGGAEYLVNPIIRGFSPDPDIIRVNDDYYIATTTFEWFPGVTLYHSRDLVHWHTIGGALNRKTQLDLTGVPNSGGIYIPSLLYRDGTFYLVYSVVYTSAWPFVTTRCFYVTTKNIEGDWSEPVELKINSFDPAFFFDDDGRVYLIHNILDYRGSGDMQGIMLQEYSLKQNKLIGSQTRITKEEAEGPHLYKRNGFYYLLVAEGGTQWHHTSMLFRSINIRGPYEPAPNNPILTSRDKPFLTLQKAGQGALVETQNGDWYLVHHASRPLPAKDSTKRWIWGNDINELPAGNGTNCPLGRETCLQKVEWTKDGWLRLSQGGHNPFDTVPLPPQIKIEGSLNANFADDFKETVLNKTFYSLRSIPDESWISLIQRPGFLRLYGREAITSWFNQSLIARRWDTFYFTAETAIEFNPLNYNQMAGLTCFYDTRDFVYLYISYDENIGKSLNILWGLTDKCLKPVLEKPIKIKTAGIVYLKVEVKLDQVQFYYSEDANLWQKIGPVFDARQFSDEGLNRKKYSFTGAMVGICTQDMTYQGSYADFDYFKYLESKE